MYIVIQKYSNIAITRPYIYYKLNKYWIKIPSEKWQSIFDIMIKGIKCITGKEDVEVKMLDNESRKWVKRGSHSLKAKN